MSKGFDSQMGKKVCIHLKENTDKEYRIYFTGEGIEYYLICWDCCKDLNDLENNLINVSVEHFDKIRSDIWNNIGMENRPEIKVRQTNLKFEHKLLNNIRINEQILDIKAVEKLPYCKAIAVTDLKEIISINFSDNTLITHVKIPESTMLNFDEAISLHISGDGALAAVVNTFGQYGIVIDLKTGKILMNLDRGDYYNEHCIYPVAFIEREGCQLLVHGTNWNRLDITNLSSGKLITLMVRSKEETDAPNSNHYLDYFHCSISVSVDSEWIVDNGWVWHPLGQVVTWNIGRWIKENVWESEDGETRKSICVRNYYWEGNICWIDNNTIAVYGYGDDSDCILPAVRVFDIITGNEIRWFPGPVNSLTFDEYLFSFAKEHGTSVWDIETGEMLLHDISFCPSLYHRGSKQFISIQEDGMFILSQIKDGI